MHAGRADILTQTAHPARINMRRARELIASDEAPRRVVLAEQAPSLCQGGMLLAPRAIDNYRKRENHV